MAGRMVRRPAWLLVAWWLALLAPMGGAAVFWLLPFKPAVTLYAAIAALAVVLQRLLAEVQRLREIHAIARREVHDYYAR